MKTNNKRPTNLRYRTIKQLATGRSRQSALSICVLHNASLAATFYSGVNAQLSNTIAFVPAETRKRASRSMTIMASLCPTSRLSLAVYLTTISFLLFFQTLLSQHCPLIMRCSPIYSAHGGSKALGNTITSHYLPLRHYAAQ